MNTQNNSYTSMLTKMMITTVSEKDYDILTNGPLCYNNPSGLTYVAANLVKGVSSIMTHEASSIWGEIVDVKDYVNKRSEIDEKKMFTVTESKDLLTATENVQEVIHHLSSQEEIFIELTEKVHEAIHGIFRKYIEKHNNSVILINEIIEDVVSKMEINLPEDKDNEKVIVDTSTIDDLKIFSKENSLEKVLKIDPIDFLEKKYKHYKYDEFILIQASLIIYSRFSAYQMSNLDLSKTLDIEKTNDLIKENINKARELIDMKNLAEDFDIGDISDITSLRENLENGMVVNEDFKKNLEEKLNDLIILCANREPKEEETEEEEEEEEEDQEAA